MPNTLIDDLNHRCRSGDSCVSRVPEDDTDGKPKYRGAITAAPDTLCPACIKRLQDQLEQLPHLKGALRSFLGTSLTATHGSKVSSTKEHSTPINLRVLDLMDEIRDVISRAGGPGVRVGDLVGRPAEEFPLFRGGGLRTVYLDGVDRALAIGTVWRKADGVVGLSRTWQKRKAPCPRCGQVELGSWLGEDTIHCMSSSCGAWFPWSEYQRLCLAKYELERLEGKSQ